MSGALLSKTTFKSSELSRASADVFAAAVDHPVQVTRRDGESLVLMSESADKARDALLDLAAHLVAVSTTAEGTLLKPKPSNARSAAQADAQGRRPPLVLR